MSTLVSIRNLHKTYQRGPEKVDVLHGLDLDIDEGDFVALMGPSGSGKTTLLNLIGGLDSPTARRDRSRRPAHRHARLRPALALAQQPRRLRVPVLQPDADAERAEERRAAAAADQPVGGAAQAQRRDRAGAGRPEGSRQAPPGGTVRRPAAARGDRPRDRVRSHAADLRRADRRPRPPVGRGNPRACCRCSTASTARPS